MGLKGRTVRWVIVVTCLTASAATGGACGNAQRSPAAPSPAASGPPLSTPPRGGCFGWPATEFAPGNAATVQTFVQPGTVAFDVTLRDIDGRAYTLSALLATQPVLLVTGAYS